MKCSANFKDFPSLAETLLLLAQTPPVSENNEDNDGRNEIVQAGTKELAIYPQKNKEWGRGRKGRTFFFCGSCLLLINLWLPGSTPKHTVPEHSVNICNIYCLLPGKVHPAGESGTLRKKRKNRMDSMKKDKLWDWIFTLQIRVEIGRWWKQKKTKQYCPRSNIST